MSDLITDCGDYDAFAREWHANDLAEHEVTLERARDRELLNERDTRQLWQLLGLLAAETIVVRLPEWLAEEKLDDPGGTIPTTFIGHVTRETDKAILFEGSAAAQSLMRLAHRIHSLEHGLENAGMDDDRREVLEHRLEEKRRQLANREGVASLSDEWLPTSQITSAIRRCR